MPDDRMINIEAQQQAFDALRTQLIDQGHGGKYVLFAEASVQGFFESTADAYKAGLARYGSSGVFVVDQIVPKKPEMLSMSWELGMMSP